MYSTALSDADKSNQDRLSKHYQWLQNNAKHIDALRDELDLNNNDNIDNGELDRENHRFLVSKHKNELL